MGGGLNERCLTWGGLAMRAGDWEGADGDFVGLRSCCLEALGLVEDVGRWITGEVRGDLSLLGGWATR